MWEVGSEDFIYCVALSNDMQYVSFGGTARKSSCSLRVLERRSSRLPSLV